MVAAGGMVAAFDLNARGRRGGGDPQERCRRFTFPAWLRSRDPRATGSGALAIALLGLVEAVSIAKAIAGQTRQRLNINQEFLAPGGGQPGRGVFQRLSRQRVLHPVGRQLPVGRPDAHERDHLGRCRGRHGAAGRAPGAASLPVAALAGVLLVVAAEMIRFEDIRRTIRSTRNDAAVLVITFLSTLFLNIEFAIYVGVLLSIGLHMATTSHPRIYSTVPDFKTGQMAGAAHGRMCCQMDIIRIEGSIFFGSAAFVQEDLQRRLKSHPELSSMLIRMHQVNNFDASGVQVLRSCIAEEVRARGGGLYFSGVNTRVFQVFKNSGLLKEVGETHFRSTTGSAIRQAMRESFCPFICAQCEVAVFVECRELKMGNWEVLGRGLRPRCGHSEAEHQAMAPKHTGRLEWPE